MRSMPRITRRFDRKRHLGTAVARTERMHEEQAAVIFEHASQRPVGREARARCEETVELFVHRVTLVPATHADHDRIAMDVWCDNGSANRRRMPDCGGGLNERPTHRVNY